MVNAPEKIRVAQDSDGFWTCREAISGSQEYVRADLYAALEAQLAKTQEKLIEANDKLIRQNEALFRTGAVKVKPLVWEYHPAGLVASAGGIGEAYIIDTRIARRVYFLKGMDPNRAYTSVEAAKAAAQADYERRIPAALEPAEPGPAAEAVACVERGSEQSTPQPESRLREARLREALKEAEDAMRFAYTSCATFPQEPQHIQNAAWRRIVNALTKAHAALKEASDERA